MARITLDRLRHSYMKKPSKPGDYALQEVDIEWEDGGAYALLGPSGCGKTTLLNITSGLLTASEGRILFDGKDVTRLPPDRRNIAQVFQFPVIYDTMTVRENLEFPLRNRGVAPAEIAPKVAEILEMLELVDMADSRAAGLTADQKQKISLGRGLVRSDTSAILFDEPLTVIDPHLKWKLRSKLKELHQRVRTTMIYVTHDQTEALTFADQVVVMQDGQIVQVGTPQDLFEKPRHTFVGHFIGSPGMNLIPARPMGREGSHGFAALAGGLAGDLGEITVETANHGSGSGHWEIGVRPEFVRFASPEEIGVPATVTKIADAGRFRVIETRVGEVPVRMLAAEGTEIPADPHLRFDPGRTFLYRDSWMVGEDR